MRANVVQISKMTDPYSGEIFETREDRGSVDVHRYANLMDLTDAQVKRIKEALQNKKPYRVRDDGSGFSIKFYPIHRRGK